MSSPVVHAALEPDLRGRSLGVDVNAVDEANPVRMRLHHERRGADAVAEETHAFHQRAVGPAGCGKHDVRPRGELLRAIDSRDVCDPHRMTALLMLRAVHDEPRVDLATETAHRGSGKHAFRRTTGAHYRVHAAADDGGGDAGGQI